MKQDTVFESLTEEQEDQLFEHRFSPELIEILKSFTNERGTANLYFEESSSLLDTVASFVNPEAVQYLLDQGADPNAIPPSKCGMSPLAACADSNDEPVVECVRLLLNAGANPCGTEIDRELPLVRAIWAGAIKTCRLLLEADGQTKKSIPDRKSLKDFRKSAELTDEQKQAIIEVLDTYGIAVP